MQPVPPRPPSSVPLGGSLRASRAAQLARPKGPLVAVDLADGAALLVHLVGSEWVALAEQGEVELTARLPPAPEPAFDEFARPPPRRRRIGAALALAAALGAAVVGLAMGLAPGPSPASARATARPRVAPALPRPARRGGHATAPAHRRAPPSLAPPAPPPVTAAPAAPPPAPVAPPPPPPAPPPLPELPAVPAL